MSDAAELRELRLAVRVGALVALFAMGDGILTVLLDPGAARSRAVAWGLAGACAVFSVAVLRLPVARWGRPALLVPSLFALAVITVACLNTGGVASKYALYFLVLAAGAAFFLTLRDTLLISAGTVVASGVVLLAGSGGLSLDTLSRWASLALLATLFAPVVQRTREQARRAGAQAEAAARRAREDSLRDPLTELFNRRGFALRAGRALAEVGGTGALAVVYLDLDDFKAINDEWGHAAGDRALVEVARGLRASVRDGDAVARFGGDEFAILMPGAGAEDVQRVVARIHSALSAAGERFGLAGGSIGAALHPRDGRTEEALVHAADLAQRAQKRRSTLQRAAAS